MGDFPPLLTAAQMRAADAAASATFGIPSLLLMENAGRGVADIARRELGEIGKRQKGKGDGSVAVVCGAGANGGDGFVAARHLAQAGVAVHVSIAAPRDKIRGDAATMLAALERMGNVAVDDGSGWSEQARWTAALAGADVIVDALFGIGVRPTPPGLDVQGDRRTTSSPLANPKTTSLATTGGSACFMSREIQAGAR